MNTSLYNSFDTIYKNKIWEFNGVLSGAGSIYEGVQEYIEYLKLFKEYSVLDIGCGDCKIYNNIPMFKKHIGIDVVNITDYSELPNFIEFKNQSITEFNTNDIDIELILIKDVFQHLSNKSIFTIINKIKKFKNCKYIITNDFNFSELNTDCTDASYRPLNLRKSPFNFDISQSFKWESKFDKFKKETVIIENFL